MDGKSLQSTLGTKMLGKCYVCRKHVENKDLELVTQNDNIYYVCPDCREEMQ